MQRTMLKSKIHRATVTGADLNYEGSITIDAALLEAADILVNEQVDVYNCNNGQRFTTYAIPGGKGEICVNGAAARLVHKGDLLIIANFAQYSAEELESYEPKLIFVDAANAPKANKNPLASTVPVATLTA